MKNYVLMLHDARRASISVNQPMIICGRKLTDRSVVELTGKRLDAAVRSGRIKVEVVKDGFMPRQLGDWPEELIQAAKAVPAQHRKFVERKLDEMILSSIDPEDLKRSHRAFIEWFNN